jgi:hypothetical protein
MANARSAPRAPPFVYSWEEILREPGRPFALYLRSFVSDDIAHLSTPRGFIRKLIDYIAPGEAFGNRPEERLVVVAHGIGPMIALGRPGDSLPQIGAARIYIGHTADDLEWQTTVTDLCRRAGLVILQLGNPTPGLLWELENARHLVDPERLVIYLPRGATANPELRGMGPNSLAAIYSRHFPKSLPPELGDARCIVFDRDWNPTLIGPWTAPIRSAVGVLNEDHGLTMKPAELGLDEDTLSLLSALEQNYPDYNTPVESALPFDLRVHRIFEVLLGPLGKLAGSVALIVIVWPDSVRQLQNWLSQWI